MIPPTAAAIIVFVSAGNHSLVRVLVVDRFVPGAGAKNTTRNPPGARSRMKARSESCREKSSIRTPRRCNQRGCDA